MAKQDNDSVVAERDALRNKVNELYGQLQELTNRNKLAGHTINEIKLAQEQSVARSGQLSLAYQELSEKYEQLKAEKKE